MKIFIKYALLISLSIANLHAQNKDWKKVLQDSSYLQLPADKKFDFLVKKYIDAYYKDVNMAAFYVNKINELAKLTKKPSHQFVSIYTQSKISFLKGEYTASLKLLNKSLKIARKNNDLSSIIKCYNSMGTVYKADEKYQKALEYYIKALKVAEKKPETYKIQLSNILNNMANISSYSGNYKDAIRYLKKSLQYNTNEKNNIAVYINFGLNYLKLKINDSATYYLNKSYKLSKLYDNKLYESVSLSIMGDIYATKQQYQKALNYYLKALKLQKETGVIDKQLQTYVGIINTYLYLNQKEKAKEYIEQYKKISGNKTSKDILTDLLLQQAIYYEKKNDLSNALQYYKKYIHLKDSLSETETKIQLQKIKNEFEAEKKQRIINQLKAERLQKELETERQNKEILLLKSKNELQKQELEKNKLINENKQNKIEILNREKQIQQVNLETKKKLIEKTKTAQKIILTGAIIILIPLLILLVMFKQKLRSQRLIQIQKEKINNQRFIEIKKNKQLSALKAKLTGQHIERKRIAKELHDGLGGNLAGIKVRLLKIFHNQKNKEIDEVIQKIDNTCEEIRTISHDLMPPDLKNENFVNLIKKIVYNIAKQQNWEVELECFPENEINLLPKKLKLEIYRIVQEIINNIYKHSETKTIDFQLIMHNNYINLLVEDFGKGFNPNTINKGLGLSNIRERVMLLKGITKIDSKKGRGTIINIKIPII